MTRMSSMGIALVLCGCNALAQSAAEVTLTRLDCGNGVTSSDIAFFSDTNAYDGMKQDLVVSCYLIKHGDDYLIWDAGYPAAVAGTAATGPTAKFNLVEQLARINVKPEQVKFVGVSHYHGDHIGQAGSFAQATLRRKAMYC